MNHEQEPADQADEHDELSSRQTPDSALEAEIAELKTSMAALREDTLRERAELDNQRRRMARDLDVARRFANERVLADLLPVLDSLHAGLKVAGAEPHPLKAGLEMTLRQLLKTACDHGLVEVNPLGGAFDPERHQAVTQLPSADAAPGTVLEVFQRGYVLNERLLRPALVVVAADASA